MKEKYYFNCLIEAIKKLGTVDIYQASAWVTLLNDLEHLGLKICEVEE